MSDPRGQAERAVPGGDEIGLPGPGPVATVPPPGEPGAGAVAPTPATAAAPAGSRTLGGAPLYKGEPLDAERGPGLGCFWFQVIVLAVLVVLTPVGVMNAWPQWLTTVMLFATLVLLLLAGQTVIFLLRLVAADRRTRRRPLGGATQTVGQIEEAAAGRADDAVVADQPEDAAANGQESRAADHPEDPAGDQPVQDASQTHSPGMRQ